MSAWALVLAAGGGARFGGAKQFAPLDGERLVDRAVRTAATSCDAVVVVLPAGFGWDGPPVAAAVGGGATRAASVRAGLAAVPADADVVVVHDAVHPLASPALFAAVIAAVRDGAVAAVPAVPVTEAVRRVEHGRYAEDVPRGGLVLVQMPQAFRADALRAAHAGAADVVEDSLLLWAAGADVAVVPGEHANVHVTTPAELSLVRRLR